MKKIASLLLLALTLPFLACCEDDTDSNPVLQHPDSFVLNVPPFAANNVYDLEHSTSVELTCTQPAYGFTAATNYAVQVTLDEAFTEATDEAEANYVELSTFYTTARMDVDAYELNSAIISLWEKAHPNDELPADVAVTLRLRAYIASSTGTDCFSTPITLPHVHAVRMAAPVALPESMYIIGSLPAAENWSKWVKFAAVNGQPGVFFTVVYCNGDTNFKIGPAENDWEVARTYDQLTFTPEAVENAGACRGTDSGNSAVSKAGWYTFIVTTKVQGKEVAYTVDIRPAEVYLIGNATGGSWGFADEWKFQMPEGDGEWVSPAATASGECRMAVKVPEAEWWATEFTLQDGSTIFWRENNNIVSGWADNKGAAYSVDLSAGKRVHLDFTHGTGSVE